MTPAQIEKMGIPRILGRKFYIPGVEREVTIPEYYGISDIYRMVYELGVEGGKRKGRNEKSEQIKRALETEEEY
jgi:hypothetical protein